MEIYIFTFDDIETLIFDFKNERLIESCNLSVLDDNYGAFDIQLRDKTNKDESSEMYLPFLLKEAINIFRADKNGKYITENNEDFLSVFNRVGIDPFKKDLYDKSNP